MFFSTQHTSYNKSILSYSINTVFRMQSMLVFNDAFLRILYVINKQNNFIKLAYNLAALLYLCLIYFVYYGV